MSSVAKVPYLSYGRNYAVYYILSYRDTNFLCGQASVHERMMKIVLLPLYIPNPHGCIGIAAQTNELALDVNR